MCTCIFTHFLLMCLKVLCRPMAIQRNIPPPIYVVPGSPNCSVILPNGLNCRIRFTWVCTCKCCNSTGIYRLNLLVRENLFVFVNDVYRCIPTYIIYYFHALFIHFHAYYDFSCIFTNVYGAKNVHFCTKKDAQKRSS